MLQKYNINYQKYISYILIAYAFSFPISKAATNLFEILALLLWIFEGNWKEKFQLYTHNLLSITVLGLIGYSLLSILWHGDAQATLNYIMKYRHLLLIFVFYSSFDTRYAHLIISAFLSAMFISELFSYGIFFELIHYKDISPSDPTPFMSHMTYSTLLAFTSTLLLIEFFHTDTIKSKLLYGVFFLSVITNLFMNGGRSGQMIFIVLLFFLLLRHIQNKFKAIVIIVALLSTIFGGAYLLSPNFHTRILELKNDISMMHSDGNYTSSAGARIALNVIAFETFKEHPLLGTGIAKEMQHATLYADQLHLHLDGIEFFADAHNTFATISTQLGIGGLILSLLIIYTLFSFKLQNPYHKDMALMFALSFVIFSCTHNTLHTMNSMVFFALFGGFFNVLSRFKTKEHL